MLVKEKSTQLKMGYRMESVSVKDGKRIANLVNAFSLATMGIKEMTQAELETFWKTPRFNLGDDTRKVIGPNGEVAGYVECMRFTQPPVHPYIWMSVHPDHLHDGVTEALLDWAMDRAKDVLDILPADLRVSIHMHNVGGFKPWQKVIESAGFRLTRHSFIMHREMKEAPAAPQWPVGITLRPYDPEKHAESVYRANDEAFSDHFGHINQTFEEGFAMFKHWMEEPTFDPSLWFVAVEGDEVAGVSLCRISDQEDPPIGWVGDLSVRRAWRKRGLGMALLQHSFGEFYRRGFRKAGLGVDASNLTGALRLYERAGMHVARQYDRYEKELRPGRELMTTEVND